ELRVLARELVVERGGEAVVAGLEGRLRAGLANPAIMGIALDRLTVPLDRPIAISGGHLDSRGRRAQGSRLRDELDRLTDLPAGVRETRLRRARHRLGLQLLRGGTLEVPRPLLDALSPGAGRRGARVELVSAGLVARSRPRLTARDQERE